MIGIAGLLLRFYRFQIGAVLLVALGVAGVAAYHATQINALEIDPACSGTASAAGDGCAALGRFRELAGFEVVRLMGFIGFVPFVAGAMLGAPVVAREIEHQTAVLPWSLDGRRWRWLGERAVLLLIVLGIALIGPVFAAWLLADAAQPTTDPRASFAYYGMHGWPLVLRGLLVFSVGILMGALLGRVLPALVATAAAAGLIFFLLSAVQKRWVEPTTVSGAAQAGVAFEASMFVGGAYRDASGALLTRAEVEALSPEPLYTEVYNTWLEEKFDHLTLLIEGDRYPQVELRESLTLGAASALVLGAAVLVVRRRAPY